MGRQVGPYSWRDGVVAGVEEEFLRQVRAALGDDEYRAARAEGAAQSMAEAVNAARGVPQDVGTPAGR